MTARREYLRNELVKLLREAQPASDPDKRTAIRESASATHSELLLRYWLRENYGVADLEAIEGFALDRAMRYIKTVAGMLQRTGADSAENAG